jgi:hypothetical protein
MNRFPLRSFIVTIGVAFAAVEGCAAPQNAPAASPPPLASGVPPMPPPAVPSSTPASAPLPQPAASPSPPIDESAVASATGADKPEKSPDGTVKASFPRKDVEVAIDDWKVDQTAWEGKRRSS